jgi:Domain of unknown function (DUF4111)/Nucleotidyltransferase domain
MRRPHESRRSCIMSSTLHQLDKHPDVAALLRDLIAGLESILGIKLLAMYLHGSLVTGDFDEDSSDIDFLAVTAEPLTRDEFEALVRHHEYLAAKHPRWARELEGSYVPRADLTQLFPENDVCPGIERGGKLEVCEQDINYRIVHMYVIRHSGIGLCGPQPSELLAPVSEAELRQAVIRILRGWWAPMLDDDRRLRDLHYRSYAVQTMCRILYTLAEGGVVSKPAAAAWANEKYGQRWGGLIDAACAWPRVELGCDLQAACSLIHFVLEVASEQDITQE